MKNSNVKKEGRGRLRWNNRAIHRDLGYFYLGLIIAYSLSGILLNHRIDWHLDKYTVSRREVTVDLNKWNQNPEKNLKDSKQTENNGGKNSGRNNGNARSGRHGGKGLISSTFARDFAKEYGIDDTFRRQFIQRGELRLSYVNHRVEIDLNTGKAVITESRTTPFLGQIVKLHRTNSEAWIYFSDFFAISLILIAITGIILPRGNKSFRKRGWKFALAGIVFPLIVVFFIL